MDEPRKWESLEEFKEMFGNATPKVRVEFLLWLADQKEKDDPEMAAGFRRRAAAIQREAN